MPYDWFDPNLAGVCFVGLVGAVLGLSTLLAPSRLTRSAVPPAVLAVVFGAASAALAAAGQPAGFWLGPLVVAAPCAAFAALRTPWPAHGLGLALQWAGRARLQGAALLVASPLLALGWAWASFPEVPEWKPDPALDFAKAPVGVRQVAATASTTDAGRPVPLYFRARPSDEAILKRGDAAVFSAGEYAARAIRLAPPSEDYNCHGWVFTGGRYWIQDEDVEPILQDNGYQPVAAPRPGDLAVYRASAGESAAGPVLHTGVVRVADPGQPVLVESKWGKSSRYLHQADAVPYACEPLYYRSSRDGHLLNHLDAPPVAATQQ
jgi:hypothetical protein